MMSLDETPVAPHTGSGAVRRFFLLAGGLLLWATLTTAFLLLSYMEAWWHGSVPVAVGGFAGTVGGLLNFLALALWVTTWAARTRQAMAPGFRIVGPYRFVRNPLALAALLQGLGVACSLGSLWTAGVALLAVPLVDLLLGHRLEMVSERRFGEAFALYRRRVRPWRWRRHGYDPAHEEREPPLAVEVTTAPGRHVVLFDGHCNLCRAGSARFLRLTRPGLIERVDFQEAGTLDRFPGVSHAACMTRMYLITPDGRVYGGFEAAVRTLATRRLVGWLALAYYLPGLHLLFDLLYELVAANRYRLFGKPACTTGACSLHFTPK